MKTKDMKKLIVDKASETEIKDFSANIMQRAIVRPVVAEKKSRLLLKIAYGCLPLASLVIIFAVIILFLDKNNHDTYVPTPVYEVTKADDILGFEALSLGNIVQSEMTQQTLTNVSLTRKYKDNDRDNEKNKSDLENTDYIHAIDTLNKYMLTVEGLFSTETLYDVLIEQSDKEEYTYKMVTSARSDSEHISYTIYYNELATKKDNRIKIEGIILLNNESFPLTGSKKTKDDEVETELRIVTSDSSYIVVEQETEVNENEWEYEYYEKGKKVLSVEFEKEDNGVKLSVDNMIDEFEYEVNKKDNRYHVDLECNDKDKGGKIEVTVDLVQNKYTYSYSGGSFNCNRKKGKKL